MRGFHCRGVAWRLELDERDARCNARTVTVAGVAVICRNSTVSGVAVICTRHFLHFSFSGMTVSEDRTCRSFQVFSFFHNGARRTSSLKRAEHRGYCGAGHRDIHTYRCRAIVVVERAEHRGYCTAAGLGDIADRRRDTIGIARHGLQLWRRHVGRAFEDESRPTPGALRAQALRRPWHERRQQHPQQPAQDARLLRQQQPEARGRALPSSWSRTCARGATPNRLGAPAGQVWRRLCALSRVRGASHARPSL